MRVGIGYDIHRIVPTQEKESLIIGGHKIECFFRPQAHSDGDVLLHALVDAMLGSLAMGDIGQWFPDTDPVNENRPSKEFVEVTVAELAKLGWKVAQLDSIVWLERPKLAPEIGTIREKLAQLLNLELHQISIKAKTMETVGTIGAGGAMSAQVILTTERIESK